MKIKITVGMCSVEYEGQTHWSEGVISEIIAALSRASVENEEARPVPEVEIKISAPDGALYPLAWKCNHDVFLCTEPSCAHLYVHHRKDCENMDVPGLCSDPGGPPP